MRKKTRIASAKVIVATKAKAFVDNEAEER